MKNILKPVLHAIIFLTAFSIAPTLLAANAVIDVLVVYTKGVADTYGGNPTTRFNQVFQVTNQIYKDSNVNVEIRLVKAQQVDYTDDNDAGVALNDITYAKVPALANIAALRDQVKADMVLFYRPFKSVQASCGIAWIGGGANGDFSNPDWKKFMYAHVAITACGDYVTAHELGHNMGLKHSRKQDGSGGAFPYALGYGVDNKFTTIMAYQSSFNVDYWSGKLYKFSNPDLVCAGMPCGIDRNNPTSGADAHYALNITAPQIAKFNTAPDAGVISSTASSSSSLVVASSSSSKASSSIASSVKSSSTSSAASSAVNSSQLSSLRAKVTQTKNDYDAAAAAAALAANTAAIQAKLNAEATLVAQLNAANTAASNAVNALNLANTKNASALADLKTATSKLTAAQSAYASATVANKAAAKVALDAAQAAYTKAQSAALAATAALNAANTMAINTMALVNKLKADYATAQKATLAEKALTAGLNAKLATTAAAYDAAKKALAAVSPESLITYKLVPDVAQYRLADWKNEVRRERGISVDRAKEIAAADPSITYFFITKGYRMILQSDDGKSDKGVFYYGDAVFFSGKPWYGSAPGLADAYEKNSL